jgi:tape measure domain-containing protein
MADDVSISIRLRNAAKFVKDSAQAAKSVRDIGSATTGAAGAAARMGGAVQAAAHGMNGALGAAASQAHILALGVGAAAAAGVKMGLSFNAQIESARLRFGLFTDDVDGLTKAVQRIDMTSAFNLADLSDAAALLGNSGVEDIPNVLQAAANAAAASGRGAPALNSIAIALSQIASKGRLSQEEINQLNEAGAPGAQRIIAEHFHLTANELQNLGGQGLDAREAIEALTAEWTSGRMAQAAEAQTRTLGGQWDLLTGNIQKLSGAATESLAAGLREKALPAVNDAVQHITEIFGREGLSNEQKIAEARAVIIRELGPIWHELAQEIDHADIPGKLGQAVAAATPRMLNAMADIAPQAAKAFVDGWLASGPEAQVITALFLGNKLRKSDFGKALFTAGSGSGKSSAATLFAGRGATPTNPVWVRIVGGKGGVLDTAEDLGKKTGAAAIGGRAAWAVARMGGLAEFGSVAAGAVPLAGILGLAKYGSSHNFDFASRAGGGSVRQQASRQLPAPGFGGGPPGALNINLNVDGKTVSRVTATTDQIEQGRLAAARAARG